MKPGTIGWVDLTVANAEQVRDFYSAVVGWTPGEIDMGEYKDYSMHASDGVATSGVCHARGANADLPPSWIIYIVVADLDASLTQCEALGGRLVLGPKSMGKSRYAIIEDPAGAVSALYESNE